jgi:hypothetical protein
LTRVALHLIPYAILLGPRAVDLLNGDFRRLTRHQRFLTVSVALVVGLCLVGDGIALIVNGA